MFLKHAWYCALFEQGTWAWTSDHDLETGAEVTIYTGRGIYSQSAGPVWMIGVGA